jgi:predicted esterase
MRFFVVFFGLMLTALASHAATNSSNQVSATIQELVPASQLASLAKTYPIDQPIHWKLFEPRQSQAPGLLVFVSARDLGDPPPEWIHLLEEHNLIWIAACDFGNAKPTAQRALAALMGLAYVQRGFNIDHHRVYVAGMSGGGRVASKVITKFPRLFTGAIYIVGADFWEASEAPPVPEITRNRYVFITGSNDFNRREMTSVFHKYLAAGAEHSTLMDLPHFGHQLPSADQLRDALVYLDEK